VPGEEDEMARQESDGITREQRKALKDASSGLDRAYADALAKVKAAGIEIDDSTFCKVAPRNHCRSFRPPQRGSRCARPGCGHLFSQHHLPM
jgi:hypothetical protein